MSIELLLIVPVFHDGIRVKPRKVIRFWKEKAGGVGQLLGDWSQQPSGLANFGLELEPQSVVGQANIIWKPLFVGVVVEFVAQVR